VRAHRPADPVEPADLQAHHRGRPPAGPPGERGDRLGELGALGQLLGEHPGGADDADRNDQVVAELVGVEHVQGRTGQPAAEDVPEHHRVPAAAGAEQGDPEHQRVDVG
jgi:hypothetical protein